MLPIIVIVILLILNIYQAWHFNKSREVWIRNAEKINNEFERIKTVSNRLRYRSDSIQDTRSQPLRPKNYRLQPFEKLILEAGFEFSSGPDRYSITVLRQLTAWKEGGMFAPAAHYWPKKQWWNLIGDSEKGHGIEKMIFALKGGGKG